VSRARSEFLLAQVDGLGFGMSRIGESINICFKNLNPNHVAEELLKLVEVDEKFYAPLDFCEMLSKLYTRNEDEYREYIGRIFS
jgi:hypothetical protein